jgi:uncharacterized surface protein with fasciclin (FAS1) repeats
MRTRQLFVLVLVAVTQIGCGSSPDTDALNRPSTPVTPGQSASVLDLISDRPELSTLAAGVGAADLTSRLESNGPLTLFAPNDTAWEQLGTDRLERLMTSESKNLRQGILNHTVDGRYLTIDLRDGQKLKSLGGPTLTVKTEGGKMSVNGSELVAPDSQAANGVVHVIDKVIR